ncbi:DNA alkylation repair protein [Geofilum rubicundum]|uniref:Peptidase, M49 family n=1 Tax=Geofilum rubicundum JCM 15548 TaxID=1236989 RepID=A0A0E9LVU1_9BACT|nr:DNA alkylation repair protein [Geofilum rubicundum]GAO29251.1 peptidase, M49 family [Geofilum rubicundum JCM 15548]
MKFFAYNENLEEQMKLIQQRIRKLMNGEIASQLQVAGLNYPKLYGVSLVHLRQLSQGLTPSNELADRLWHRNIRETMILATMVARRDSISDEQLMQWAEGINNLELAEQIAFNLLGKREQSAGLIEAWMLHPQFYVRYAALMALGWQFRFGDGAARTCLNPE